MKLAMIQVIPLQSVSLNNMLGGPKREFLTLINQELFDPRKGIFQTSANSNNVQISPFSRNVPSHLRYLELAGMMLAKVTSCSGLCLTMTIVYSRVLCCGYKPL